MSRELLVLALAAIVAAPGLVRGQEPGADPPAAALIGVLIPRWVQRWP